MKLRNKKTGEIGTLYQNGEGIFYEIWVSASGHKYLVDSLAELNEEWEDYEEPKEFFAISPYKIEGYEVFPYDNFGHIYKLAEELGITFKTKEEAEKAVEKLKAWKRLKDKGFKFEWWLSEASGDHIEFYMDSFGWDNEATKDLDLLFGSGDLEAKNE